MRRIRGETAPTRSHDDEDPGEYGIVARTGLGGMTDGRWPDPPAGRGAAPARGRAAAAARPRRGRGRGRLAGPVGGRS